MTLKWQRMLQMSLEGLNSAERTFYVGHLWLKSTARPATDCFALDDFFTHGFDGSGGDNYFDAGSCIDGRLTSAWNCKV